MSKTTNSTKKGIINTASVKVVFNTSSKEFTAIMSRFYLAIREMSDKNLLYRKNLKAANDWLETLTKANKDGKKDAKIAEQLQEIENMKAVQSELVKEINERIENCYALIPDSVYEGYKKGNFDAAIKEFFSFRKIETTPTLIAFMNQAIGLKCASAKVMFKTNNTLDFMSKKQFNKIFMSTLAQLMKDKNALKTDDYKWKYVESDKKAKKN